MMPSGYGDASLSSSSSSPMICNSLDVLFDLLDLMSSLRTPLKLWSSSFDGDFLEPTNTGPSTSVELLEKTVEDGDDR